MTWACTACTNDFKQDECFCNGKYCAPNHIRDDFNRVLGRDIIYEDLRQSCLFENLKKTGETDKWWSYMREVHAECYGFISKACSKNAHERKGLDWDATQKCVNESFFSDDHANAPDNLYLRDNADAWKEYGTLYWPSVTINRMTFRGDINPENILEDICANLINKPETCIKFYDKEHIEY